MHGKTCPLLPPFGLLMHLQDHIHVHVFHRKLIREDSEKFYIFDERQKLETGYWYQDIIY